MDDLSDFRRRTGRVKRARRVQVARVLQLQVAEPRFPRPSLLIHDLS